MLAKVDGKLYCGFIDDVGDFHTPNIPNKLSMGYTRIFEPITLKPGDKVRLKKGEPVWLVNSKYLQEAGAAYRSIKIKDVIGSMVYADNIAFHESSIAEIIEETQVKHTFRLDEGSPIELTENQVKAIKSWNLV